MISVEVRAITISSSIVLVVVRVVIRIEVGRTELVKPVLGEGLARR